MVYGVFSQIEQSNAPLRLIFLMLRQEQLQISTALCLCYADKSLNDTAGDKGLVPSILVFDVTPSLMNTNDDLRNQRVLFKYMKSAR